jgi:deoxyribodipyrimidine photolyase-related protein
VKRGIYVAFDQLHAGYGALKNADPKKDLIILVESQRLLRSRSWHIQRLWFMISAARHFAKDLESQGFEVHYLKSESTWQGIEEVIEGKKLTEVVAAEPNSYKLLSDLSGKVTLITNDFFLTNKEDFINWAKSQKSLLMENFYRTQRKRLNILMEKGDKPLGGTWNFDKENRLPPPKSYDYPPYLIHEMDELDLQVLAELKSSKLNLWGSEPDQTWGTTRAAALRQLDNFLTNHFENFGPYEDAMVSENWAFHHSLLSPYMNIGLLHAEEILAAVRIRFQKGDIPLASCEGFVRQVIGWREYINGVYWFFGEDYRSSNHFNLERKLLPLFEDPTKTKMACVATQITDIHARAWVHHIPRLMVLSNLALLTGIKPEEFLNWMREVFVDAADWVMVPNVIGMGMHSDGGKMATKPYISGGAYISKMSNYCKGCIYDPKSRTGEDACPFTNLYWNFLSENEAEFTKNHRMFQQMSGLKRLSDLDKVKVESQRILKGLSQGEI